MTPSWNLRSLLRVHCHAVGLLLGVSLCPKVIQSMTCELFNGLALNKVSSTSEIISQSPGSGHGMLRAVEQETSAGLGTRNGLRLTTLCETLLLMSSGSPAPGRYSGFEVQVSGGLPEEQSVSEPGTWRM